MLEGKKNGFRELHITFQTAPLLKARFRETGSGSGGCNDAIEVWREKVERKSRVDTSDDDDDVQLPDLEEVF